ncbi:GAF domain-containing protein [Marinobacterium aestuariivivens]|uniref:GAF domain-containing protein n=1 Tax=Marinobacterium aestuariivivens TaxID=1698799 RepID=A0ABW2A326_9GAMM
MHPDHLLKGSTAVEHPKRIASARERLLSGGPLPDHTVRSVIEASWQRCLSSRVDPQVAQHGQEFDENQLQTLIHPHQELISASDIIMREAQSLLAESGTIMHLVSPAGLILRYEGDPATLELARRVSLVPGADWNEAVAGTNAIGTALSTGRALQVHAFEHFCENISRWTCSAAVIRDPFEGTLLGAVNISGLKETLHDYCLALALSGARRIEGQLAQHKLAQRDLLIDLTIGRLGAPGNDALLLFDRQGRLVRANHQAEKVLAARGIQIDLNPHNPLLNLSEGVDAAPPATAPAPSPLSRLDPSWIEPILHRGNVSASSPRFQCPCAVRGVRPR